MCVWFVGDKKICRVSLPSMCNLHIKKVEDKGEAVKNVCDLGCANGRMQCGNMVGIS